MVASIPADVAYASLTQMRQIVGATIAATLLEERRRTPTPRLLGHQLEEGRGRLARRAGEPVAPGQG